MFHNITLVYLYLKQVLNAFKKLHSKPNISFFKQMTYVMQKAQFLVQGSNLK